MAVLALSGGLYCYQTLTRHTQSYYNRPLATMLYAAIHIAACVVNQPYFGYLGPLDVSVVQLISAELYMLVISKVLKRRSKRWLRNPVYCTQCPVRSVNNHCKGKERKVKHKFMYGWLHQQAAFAC